MKVFELIKELQEVDQDADVLITTADQINYVFSKTTPPNYIVTHKDLYDDGEKTVFLLGLLSNVDLD